MAADLIHVNQGRVTFDRAVGHITTALSPLGAAASITATIGACAVEIGRFRLAADRLRIQQEMASGIIRNRQAEIILLYNMEKSRASDFNISVTSMARSLDALVNLACAAGTSKNALRMAESMIPIMTNELGLQSARAGDGLVRLSDSLRLGGIDAAVNAWRQLES
ncbi:MULTISPECIES: hypothetical protein [unclassified Streptomyces]|uniref:hypothetical protein n=1 Tax=unclassified Streptomyces TaxID=2593676 RepID=UPI002ED38CB1|nr:hypothetical protein OH827_11545 [Streptomyces sp. NBC_00891]WSY05606.1 hypothetical protein OG464_11545 [Streptomyces sp. NBC_00890]WSZ07230.1 hypothetical protein OG704_11545 [Streptomyces sp. NBC_00869]WSZ25271.1 hypothetical protein OG498_22020 [Streptomyces sp. NBC_00870]